MDHRLTHTQCLLLYSKYLNDTLPVADFCKENDVPYLQFVKWVNEWEESHGTRIVEESMNRRITHDAYDSNSVHSTPSSGERMFKPLVPDYDEKNLRSRRYFPENPYFEIELEQPIPNTVIKECSITFPSGVTLNFSNAALKTLILSVVLYEEFGSWSLEQA